MIKKTVCAPILCIALCMSLVSCGNQEKSKEKPKSEKKKVEIQWNVPVREDETTAPHFDVEKDAYHITAAIKLENGIATELSKKDYLNAVDKIEELTAKESQSTDIKITGAKTLFDVTKLKRSTQLFKQAAFINLYGEVTIERKTSEKDASAMDSLVEELYNAKTKGVSYTSLHENEGFAISGNYKYAAILFIPKIMQVTEKNGATYDYPWVNDKGYLDGIYVLAESNDYKNIPD